MTQTDLPVLRWGIVDAAARHVVKAVGSPSIEKGFVFVSEHCPSQNASVYDSYHGVYSDPEIDVVYIDTPHVLHFQNASDAIAAGKYVVVEKPITMNTRDAKRLVDAPRLKGVFLMEAVWTRSFPLTKELQRLLHEKKVIGDIRAVLIDFGLYMPIGKEDRNKPTASKALGAGALLDIGIYTLTWASIILDESPGRDPETPVNLNASMAFNTEANADGRVDEQVAMVLTYPDIKAQAIYTASLLCKSPEEFARIEGSKGTIIIGGAAAPKPKYLIVRVKGQEKRRIESEAEDFCFYYEADEAAAILRLEELKTVRAASNIR